MTTNTFILGGLLVTFLFIKLQNKRIMRQEAWIIWMLQNETKNIDDIFNDWNQDLIYGDKKIRADTYGRKPNRPNKRLILKIMNKLKSDERITVTSRNLWKIVAPGI